LRLSPARGSANAHAMLALSLVLLASSPSPASSGPDLKLQPSSTLLLAALQDDEEKAEGGGSDEPEEKSTTLPAKEVKVGGEIVGESIGGATGFKFKQGFYTQSDLGGYFRLGGFTIDAACAGVPCQPVTTSQLQPYIGLSAGYDLFQWLGIQASFGTGFVANAAPYGNRSPNVPRDYGMTFFDAGIVAQYYFLDRLAVALKLSGGGLLMTPEPDLGEPNLGGNALVGLGIRWASLLPDTFVGIDGNFHAAFVPDSGGSMLFIPAFSFAPIIKYVF
jgi:hypothetical protein